MQGWHPASDLVLGTGLREAHAIYEGILEKRVRGKRDVADSPAQVREIVGQVRIAQDHFRSQERSVPGGLHYVEREVE